MYRFYCEFSSSPELVSVGFLIEKHVPSLAHLPPPCGKRTAFGIKQASRLARNLDRTHIRRPSVTNTFPKNFFPAPLKKRSDHLVAEIWVGEQPLHLASAPDTSPICGHKRRAGAPREMVGNWRPWTWPRREAQMAASTVCDMTFKGGCATGEV